MKKEYSLALGDRTAEEIKMALGSACELEEELHAEIRGRDLVTGLPKTIVTSTRDIRRAIEEPLAAIVDAVKVTLDKTPPELAADIMTQGIVLTGGGALLHGLDVRLQAETSMPIVVAPDPLNCVALGSGMCLEEFEALRQVLISSSEPLSRPGPARGRHAPDEPARHAADARPRLGHGAHPRLPRRGEPRRSTHVRNGVARRARPDPAGRSRRRCTRSVTSFAGAVPLRLAPRPQNQRLQQRDRPAPARSLAERARPPRRGQGSCCASTGSASSATSTSSTPRSSRRPTSNFEYTLEIDRGTLLRGRDGMPVVATDGLVGTVVSRRAIDRDDPARSSDRVEPIGVGSAAPGPTFGVGERPGPPVEPRAPARLERPDDPQAGVSRTRADHDSGGAAYPAGLPVGDGERRAHLAGRAHRDGDRHAARRTSTSLQYVTVLLLDSLPPEVSLTQLGPARARGILALVAQVAVLDQIVDRRRPSRRDGPARRAGGPRRGPERGAIVGFVARPRRRPRSWSLPYGLSALDLRASSASPPGSRG